METEIYNNGKDTTTICIRGNMNDEPGDTPEHVAQMYASVKKIIDTNKTEDKG